MALLLASYQSYQRSSAGSASTMRFSTVRACCKCKSVNIRSHEQLQHLHWPVLLNAAAHKPTSQFNR
jgi:hypothetical protein